VVGVICQSLVVLVIAGLITTRCEQEVV